jgi:two-component system, cell cycle sensor histidine kinase and response regulator CckA
VQVPGWLVEHLPIAVWTADRDLVVQTFETRVVTVTRTGGERLEALFADAEDTAALCEAHRAALESGDAQFEANWRGRTWVGWVRRCGDDELLTVALDVTERLPIDGPQRAHTLEAIGRFAGGIAHDFNNILTVVIGSARYAAETVPPESAVQEDLNAITEAAQRATALTRQLLAFSRQQQLRPERVALEGVVSRAEQRIRRVVGPGIRLDLERVGDPCWVRVDAAAFEQVLIDLVRNARDAIEGVGRISIRTRSDLGEDQRSLAILEVIDDGIGMTPDVAARAFDPFFTTKPVGQGTGLGLATCHGTVHQAGGTIELYSSPTGGTRVMVSLPRDHGEHRPRPVPIARDGGERILVVEDEEFVRKVVVRALSRANYRVDAAADPMEALDRYGAHDYDLLLTDVMMPGITGDELARRMVAENPRLRVLLMSGFAGRADLGGDVLQKPFTVEVLLQQVRLALQS